MIGPERSRTSLTPNSSTVSGRPWVSLYMRRLSSDASIFLTNRCLNCSYCVGLSVHSNTDFCTRCPNPSHIFATFFKRLRPLAVSVLMSYVASTHMNAPLPCCIRHVVLEVSSEMAGEQPCLYMGNQANRHHSVEKEMPDFFGLAFLVGDDHFSTPAVA